MEPSAPRSNHRPPERPSQCSDEGGGQSLGFINSEDWISFSALDLQGSATATFRVASAGSGGSIELHADSATGPLLGSATVVSTGGWQEWVNVDVVIKDPGGSHELVLVFKHDQNAGGLFNLNWVHFQQPAKIHHNAPVRHPASQVRQNRIIGRRSCSAQLS